MAKVKTALEKIKVALAAKGYSLDEIRDSISELEAADMDLDKAADALNKNEQWVNWYQQVAPEVQNAMAERDALKAQLQQLEAAGVKLTMAQQKIVNEPTPQAGQFVTPADFEKFKSDIANANSAVIKNGLKLSFKHYKKFGAEPDWDQVEELIRQGKAANMEDAYRLWSKPMRDEAREAKIKKQIEEGIKQGVQDQISKLGVSVSRRKTGDTVEQELLAQAVKAPKEAPAPSDRELRDAFIADLNSEVTH